QVDGGLRPISEAEALTVRRRAAEAIQAVYAALGFQPITADEVEAATTAHSSDDMPERDLVGDLQAADAFLAGEESILAVVQALHTSGFSDVAANILEMGRQRIAAGYLQPAAIFDRDFKVLSPINDVNDYRGPGTGYAVSGERWAEIQRIPQARPPHDFIDAQTGLPLADLAEIGPAAVGTSPHEIVLAVGPAFGTALVKTIGELAH